MSTESSQKGLFGALVGAIVGDASNNLVFEETSSQLMLFSIAGSLRAGFESSDACSELVWLPQVSSALKNWAHLRGTPWAKVHLTPNERYRCWLMDEPSMWDFYPSKEVDAVSLRGVRRVQLHDHVIEGMTNTAAIINSPRRGPNSSNVSRATGVALGSLVPALVQDDMSDQLVSELGATLVGLVRGGAAARDAGGLFARLLLRCIVDGYLRPEELLSPSRPDRLALRQRRSLKRVLTRLWTSEPPPLPADQKFGATAFEALEIALQCFFEVQSPEEAIGRAREFGGSLSDAPMLVGALLGATYGADALRGTSSADSPLFGVAATLVDDLERLRAGDKAPSRYTKEFHPPGARALHHFDFSTGTLEPMRANFKPDDQFGPRSTVRAIDSVSIVFSSAYDLHPTSVSETGVHFAEADNGALFVHLHPTPTGDPTMHGHESCLSHFANMVSASEATNAGEFLRWCMSSATAATMIPGMSRGLMRTAEIPRQMSDGERAVDEDLAVFNLQRKARR